MSLDTDTLKQQMLAQCEAETSDLRVFLMRNPQSGAPLPLITFLLQRKHKGSTVPNQSKTLATSLLPKHTLQVRNPDSLSYHCLKRLK